VSELHDPTRSTASPRSRRATASRLGYDIIGRAAPVLLEPALEVPSEAAEELVVLKAREVFLCTRPDGDIRPGRVSGEGLYTHDTRFLSALSVQIGGRAPVLLSYSTEAGSRAVINATNPQLAASGGDWIAQQALNVRRTLVVDERLYFLLSLRSFWPTPVHTSVTVSLAADFADVFEVRGVPRRNPRGHLLAPRRLPHGVSLGYAGEDDVVRHSVIGWDRDPADVELAAERLCARWDVTLAPGADQALVLTVEPALAGRRGRRRTIETARRRLERSEHAWRRDCTQVIPSNPLFNRWLKTSAEDLHALMTPVGDAELPAAGVPWYVAPFGRDSLLTAYQALLLNHELARGTLRALAALQARADDPWRDAEPGKILHELRSGELAGTGAIPHTPYYGTVDATPLFVALAAAYLRWTGDVPTVSGLRPALDAALEWIDRWGDRDGDGFVEYERRSPAGLLNQGWKDSHDSVVHRDGSMATGPIALAEVQAYVYLAKRDGAGLYEALGLPQRAAALHSEADELRRRFDDAFWDPDQDCYALALDGDKRQVRSVTSNAAHALFCGIAENDRAARLVERLMAADMFSGWGIRTLSTESPAYNPMSYHNGSVWPHDNAIAAAGFKRYGFDDAVERIASAMFDVATSMRDFRLPELFCGFERGRSTAVVAYPVACIPQAWAAAAPILLLQTMLGLDVRQDPHTVFLQRPSLPPWLDHVELRDIRLGDARVSLACHREGDITGFSVLKRQGGVDVVMSG